MNEGSLARRYAQAFFELASEDGAIDKRYEELTHLVDAVNAAGTESQAILSNPTFTLGERRHVLDAILARLHVHHDVRNFARLLLDKGRFGILNEIHQSYQTLADKAAGRVRAEVVASGEMSPAMQERIREALSKAMDRHVVLTTRVDSSLLGGIVARVGSRVFDASLQTRLENIQRSLLESTQA
ncbi:MAG TPA: F0F1 ATP synthase subunit delta [Myxococcota bacterium]|nr:F0F1 ATP synthase subunit delta [Myxococcota bacterium]HND28525.1 F0F1 ATP synthase subunit delta [Myxococcota bacterium]HNH46325.1 F0F1 ATP synthase subunit delta [Myxococcota bacterium]